MSRKSTLLALLCAALGASAAVPFVPTTISDGQFAEDTEWYALRIHNEGYVISTSAVDANITLGRTAVDYSNPGDLWCFVGSEADGFQIYNKALGTGASMAAPSNPANDGNTGGNSYIQVKAPGAANYTYLWEFTESTVIGGQKSYYFNLKGNAAAIANKRGTNLAFWTGGKDAGSSIRIGRGETTPFALANNVVTFTIGEEKATLTSADATITTSGNKITLPAGTYTIKAPKGKAVEYVLYLDAKPSLQDLLPYPVGDYTFTLTESETLNGPELALVELTYGGLRGVPVFVTTGASSGKYNIPYRIPAITTITTGPNAGRMIASNDYRYSGVDIGSGRIDLHLAYSDDNGATWTRPYDPLNAEGKTVAMGTGQGASNSLESLNCGYGDPALVTDRETGEVFMISCCGRTTFWAGRRASPQPSARWWSKDGGITWTDPDYGQWEQIYALFDDTCPNGYIDSQFVGSGRMVQSRTIKVGSNYRIYCVMSGYHNASGNVSNWVLYSDDFGHNWHVLGDPMTPAVTEAGDEPKCEELPDGSVLLSARRSGGNRNFNIFRYTDIAKAEGTWQTHIASNLGFGNFNACNGEIMIVPVKEVATGNKHYLALQSFPYGGGRANVSIAYKALIDPFDYDTPSNFVSNWGGRLQVSTIGSTYSTMTWTADNKLGFIYEEQTYNNYGHTEMFVPLAIEEITDGKYEYVDDSDMSIANRMAREMMNYRKAQIEAIVPGIYVGQVTEKIDCSGIDAAMAAFEASPTPDALAGFNQAIVDAFANTPATVAKAGGIYRVISAHDGTYAAITTDRYLTVSGDKLAVEQTQTDNGLFTLVAPQEEGQTGWVLYNAKTEKFVCSTPAASAELTVSKVPNYLGTFTITSPTDGKSAFACTTPTNGTHRGIHMDAGQKVVAWNPTATASKWYLEFVDETTEFPSLDWVVTEMTLSQSAMKMLPGTTETLTATVGPEKAVDKTITWSSDNEEVATVDAEGVVTSVALGTAKITATCGTESKHCTVSVKAANTGIALDKTELSLEEDKTETLVATVEPVDAFDTEVVWTSSDETVATVAEGVVTAVAAGTATITAACADFTAECVVTVTEPEDGLEELLTTDHQLSTIYDLQGRRSHATRPGIYIQNGKKVRL